MPAAILDVDGTLVDTNTNMRSPGTEPSGAAADLRDRLDASPLA
jgi:hypothetical protein